MPKFQLQDRETLIGSGMMAYKHRPSLTREPTRGIITVTDRRACYYESWSGMEYMNLPLAEIAGFSVTRVLFLTVVSIHSRGGKSYAFSGFPAKRLIEWLRQAGVREL